jgi:hypothetical protein
MALVFVATALAHARPQTPAANASGQTPPLLEPASANVALEIWYEIHPGAAAQFDAYSLRRRELGSRIPNGPQRWVDVEPATGRRLVTLPAARLTDFGQERHVEVGLQALMGDLAYRALVTPFNDAQLSRRSYIRKFRGDLSWNRLRHTRAGLWGTEMTQVTIVPGKAREFERLWKEAMPAYLHEAPGDTVTVAETVAGGGPQYVLMRPLATPSDRGSFPTPGDEVERAFGAAAGRDFKRRFDVVVATWEPLVLVRTDFDAPAGPRRP